MSAPISPTQSVDVRLFGRPTIKLNGDHVPIERLGRSRLLSVFALLAIRGREGIRRDKLARLLWPNVAQQEAKANVRRHLHDITRRVLRSATPAFTENNGMLSWSAATSFTCDVVEFERLRSMGHENALAIELYRDDLLSDYDEEWIVSKREQLRGKLVERLRVACADNRNSDPHLSLNYATRWLSLDELDEEAARWVIELQCKIGQRARAYVTFDTLRQKLRDNIGVAPEQATLDALNAVVKADDDDVAQNHDTRIATLIALLEEHRYVTLRGPMASGKSRLAAGVADYAAMLFSGRVRRLDVSQTQAANALAIAVNELADSPSLLVLDNCEGREVECTRILERTPACLRVLLTSRTSICGPDALEFRVNPMPTVPASEGRSLHHADMLESVALFRQRAYLADRYFGIDADNIDRVLELLTLTDGLPGVITAAAERVRSEPLEHIIREMREGQYLDWPLYRYGMRHPSSLRAMIVSSLNSLSAEEFGALERAVRGSVITSKRSRRILSDLADKSLILLEQGGTNTGFRLLYALRAFFEPRISGIDRNANQERGLVQTI